MSTEEENKRPTRDPGHLTHCPMCGGERAKQPFPGCYWGKFGGGWVCRRDNPLLFRAGG